MKQHFRLEFRRSPGVDFWLLPTFVSDGYSFWLETRRSPRGSFQLLRTSAASAHSSRDLFNRGILLFPNKTHLLQHSSPFLKTSFFSLINQIFLRSSSYLPSSFKFSNPFILKFAYYYLMASSSTPVHPTLGIIKEECGILADCYIDFLDSKYEGWEEKPFIIPHNSLVVSEPHLQLLRFSLHPFYHYLYAVYNLHLLQILPNSLRQITGFCAYLWLETYG